MLFHEPPSPPSERQVDNFLGSGLPVTTFENGRRKFDCSSVQRIAQVHVEGNGHYREMHVTEPGPWGDLWRLHRAYSDGGVVVLMNRAYAEAPTGYARRTLQRLLEGGDLPCSKVGSSYYIPRKALEEYLSVRSSPNLGGSGAEQIPVERFSPRAITSHGIDIIQTPFQGRNRLP